MAFALTVGTAQVSGEETEVVQRKDLQTRQMSELLPNTINILLSFLFVFVCKFLSPVGRVAALAR